MTWSTFELCDDEHHWCCAWDIPTYAFLTRSTMENDGGGGLPTSIEEVEVVSYRIYQLSPLKIFLRQPSDRMRRRKVCWTFWFESCRICADYFTAHPSALSTRCSGRNIQNPRDLAETSAIPSRLAACKWSYDMPKWTGSVLCSSDFHCQTQHRFVSISRKMKLYTNQNPANP